MTVTCHATVCVRVQHNQFRKSVQNGNSAGLPPQLVGRIERIVALLDVAMNPSDLNGLPGLDLHPLRGQLQGFWSVRVSGNWRIIFRLEGTEVVDVDLLDYH